MNPEDLITLLPDLTPEEEKTIRKTLENGRKWQNYYKGEYTIIRKDKLAMLNRNTQELRQIKGKNSKPEATYCSTCATKLKTMPCDPELTYCPQCHLPHTEN